MGWVEGGGAEGKGLFDLSEGGHRGGGLVVSRGESVEESRLTGDARREN